jgi:hypothetical protein
MHQILNHKQKLVQKGLQGKITSDSVTALKWIYNNNNNNNNFIDQKLDVYQFIQR